MLLDENDKHSDDADFNDVRNIMCSPAMENCSIISDEDLNRIKETNEEFNIPFSLKINR